MTIIFHWRKIMSNQWSIAKAKANFSTLIRQVYEQHQPQIITHHGHGRVVIIPYDDWIETQKPQNSLLDFMQNSPLAHTELELPVRDVQHDQQRDTNLF